MCFPSAGSWLWHHHKLLPRHQPHSSFTHNGVALHNVLASDRVGCRCPLPPRFLSVDTRFWVESPAKCLWMVTSPASSRLGCEFCGLRPISILQTSPLDAVTKRGANSPIQRKHQDPSQPDKNQKSLCWSIWFCFMKLHAWVGNFKIVCWEELDQDVAQFVEHLRDTGAPNSDASYWSKPRTR